MCQASKLRLPIRCLTEQLLSIRRQSPKELCFDGDTELAGAVEVMMTLAKIIYILIIKVVFLFVVVFSKRNRKHVLLVSVEL